MSACPVGAGGPCTGFFGLAGLTVSYFEAVLEFPDHRIESRSQCAEFIAPADIEGLVEIALRHAFRKMDSLAHGRDHAADDKEHKEQRNAHGGKSHGGRAVAHELDVGHHEIAGDGMTVQPLGSVLKVL